MKQKRNKKKAKTSRSIYKEDAIDKSVKAAAESAREEYLRLGLKAPESRNGKIVWVSPRTRGRKRS